jgi:hypothetical protein
MVDDASRGLSGGATGMPLFSRILSVLIQDYLICITVGSGEKTLSYELVHQLGLLPYLHQVVERTIF